MARGGINKALVMRARGALLARGEHPSIDAVRIELGNTGSKSTIHRYLKELEEDEAGQCGGDVALSEELGRLVGALAERLQGEADEKVERMRAHFDEERGKLQAQLQQSEEEGRQLTGRIETLTLELQGETEALGATREQLHKLQVEQAGLLQAAQDQTVRLAERDEQIRSLEEKHRHSRDALEHYRQASREQREQEQRRHEAQLQQMQMEIRQLQQGLILKQDESTQLNRANERLANENLHNARELAEQHDRLERQAADLAALHDQQTQSHAAQAVLQERLGLQLAEADSLRAAIDAQRQETQALHSGLAAANAETQLLRQMLSEEREKARLAAQKDAEE